MVSPCRNSPTYNGKAVTTFPSFTITRMLVKSPPPFAGPALPMVWVCTVSGPVAYSVVTQRAAIRGGCGGGEG
ncbi:hypothetical protein GCM10010448_70820 [Streptomyces glomeratus]|uniref:Uncharacterized protein n=1 Tax=Streptomyces glomeratus TaxID=284452 RepID=A0ABP6M7N1_9ACTN